MATINEASSFPEPLTERELEILSCLSDGLSNQEIADHLYLSVKTVRWYNSQIYSKLGVNNREAALVAAEGFGLLHDASESSLADNNLPAQTTAFVGRQTELVEIARLLDQPDTRLITILAPGGMGKTRLALAAAERQLHHFSDGVFFVPLAPLSSPDAIVTTIVESVSFSFYSGDPPKQQLLDSLRQRHLLLVLDNFEHLLDGAPLVTEILRAAPQVKVLATSREKLNLSGETIFTISGLHFPDWETPEDALAYDAVKLFMQRTHHVRPDFELQGEHLNYLARICRLTAGMPLALVLAAGWVDVLTLKQIAGELQQGIDILETELRDVPERHRSVRVSFNYTWARLSETEREIFMKLSVFRGGFTPEAALAIAGATPRHLRKLVNKALLQILPTGRYDMHELLRQYAETHLVTAGETDVVKEAHSLYFLDFLRQREADIKGRKQIESLRAIDADRENVYAAWRWGVAHDAAEAIFEAIEALSHYAHTRTQHQFEIELLFRQAREQLGAARHPRVWARVTLQHIHLLHNGLFSSEDPFHDVIERCVVIAEEHHDLGEIALGQKLLAIHHVMARPYDPADAQRIQEVLAIYEALGDPHYISNALKWMGLLSTDNDTALGYYEKSLAIAREAGIPSSVALTLGEVAYLYLQQGRYLDAQTAFEQIEAMMDVLDDRKIQIVCLYWLSLVKFFTGEFAETRELSAGAVRIADRFGLPYSEIIELTVSALLDTLLPETPYKSQQWFEDALSAASGTRWSDALLLTVKLFETYARDDHPTAWRDALHLMKGSVRKTYLPVKIPALTVIAMLLADEGEQVHAVELLSLALNHPASPRGWLENWPLLTRKREELQTQIDQETYNMAWERGARLVLEHVIADLLAEYADAGA
jgi:predicted ATPase/DNA-binding CsgD family transcriptional regulator